jgi:hypothetical protein
MSRASIAAWNHSSGVRFVCMAWPYSAAVTQAVSPIWLRRREVAIEPANLRRARSRCPFKLKQAEPVVEDYAFRLSRIEAQIRVHRRSSRRLQQFLQHEMLGELIKTLHLQPLHMTCAPGLLARVGPPCRSIIDEIA